MSSLPKLHELIKEIALSAVDNSKPMAFIFGETISISPLKIQIDSRITLSMAQLILTNSVRDYDVEMSMSHVTEEAESHHHEYKGSKIYTVRNALKLGDQVLMIQVQGGQKFIVLEKVVSE